MDVITVNFSKLPNDQIHYIECEMSVVADLRHSPKLRLLKPMTLRAPESYPRAQFQPCTLRPASFEDVHRAAELIHEPGSKDACQGIRFCGDFECGNVASVYQCKSRVYEIHMLPDPTEPYTCEWFFFRVDNMFPGDYTFVIVGFYRQCNLVEVGSQVVAWSQNSAKDGVGWTRIGTNVNFFSWKQQKIHKWALSFDFTVKAKDCMYFANTYPYTYSDLGQFLSSGSRLIQKSVLCQSRGVDVPCVFWDADAQKCVDISVILEAHTKAKPRGTTAGTESLQDLPQDFLDILNKWKQTSFTTGVKHNKKPLVVIVARIHPGEANSSYAVEGLMRLVFSETDVGQRLRTQLSWLIVPMMNPEGVICGYYRPSTNGDDMNRVWQSPNRQDHPVACAVLDALEVLSKTRAILFFLDFHGHTALCNSFVYGFNNDDNINLCGSERVFPLLMAKHSPGFSLAQCSFLKQKQYEGTMRVVIRRKFHVPFAYTLEMSFGGSDIGPLENEQYIPDDYASIGTATARAIDDLLIDGAVGTGREVMELIPPSCCPEKRLTNAAAKITTDGESDTFQVSIGDISISQPYAVCLKLKQRMSYVPHIHSFTPISSWSPLLASFSFFHSSLCKLPEEAVMA